MLQICCQIKYFERSRWFLLRSRNTFFRFRRIFLCNTVGCLLRGVRWAVMDPCPFPVHRLQVTEVKLTANRDISGFVGWYEREAASSWQWFRLPPVKLAVVVICVLAKARRRRHVWACVQPGAGALRRPSTAYVSASLVHTHSAHSASLSIVA